MVFLVIVLTAASVTLLVLGAGALTSDQSRTVRRRLASLQADVHGLRELRDRRRRQAKMERVEALLQAVGEKVGGDRAHEANLRLQLVQAGYRQPAAPAFYLALRALLAAGLAGGMLLVLTTLRAPVAKFPLLIGVVALIGWILPSYLLRRKLNRRKQSIQRSLADALDLLVVCVEAGLGLNQALVRVGQEIERVGPELSDELALLGLEIRAGTPREEALRNLADRTGVKDVKSLVSMLIQTDRFGTSVAKALRVHAETLRDKRRQRAEEAAAKTTIKMVVPLALFVFPAVMIVIIGPAFISILKMFSGL